MGNFLEVLPLAELADGVEATLTIELVVEWFIKRRPDSGRNICFNMGQQSPPPVDAFHSEGVVVQARTRGPPPW